jgi:ABC-type nitrate/sulfonate/bicarbonate transport system ATPase subunit
VTGPGQAIELRGISKTYPSDHGPVHALDRLDLAVAAGEFVAVIGPSGCGKSSLFNIAAGLEAMDTGEVLIAGRSRANRLGASAYMPQRDALLDWQRVIDNVTLPLRLRGESKAQARATARPLLERFGLGEFVRAWPWQLSGGMRQRAAFLRTVITEPALMLLDEPFGALDGITRADLQVWLSGVWSEFASTVLLVTHDTTEAVFLSDRVYVMTPRPGRVAAVVDIDLPRPRTLADQESEAFVTLERRLRHELRASAAPDPGAAASLRTPLPGRGRPAARRGRRRDGR